LIKTKSELFTESEKYLIWRNIVPF